MNVTFDAADVLSPRAPLNSTFEVADNKENMNASFVSSPLNRTVPVERQKTVERAVHESLILAEVKRAIAAAKENPCVERIEELERIVLASFQRKEKESDKISREEDEQLANNYALAKDMAQEYVDMWQELIEKVESGGLSVGGSCVADKCEAAAKLRLEVEALQNQVDNQYADYIKIHDVYLKLRKVVDLQKEEYAQLEQLLKRERHSKEDMKGRFLRLKESATAQLDKASEDVTRMEEAYKEKTIGLRMKVKQLTTAITMKDQELELKKTELDQLREICNSLMNEVQPEMDSEVSLQDTTDRE